MITTRCWLGALVALGVAAATTRAADRAGDRVIELRADRLEISDGVLGGEGAVTLAIPIVVLPARPTRAGTGGSAAETQSPPQPQAQPPRPGPSGSPGAIAQLEVRLGYAAFGNAPLRGALFVPRLALADDERHWLLTLGFDAKLVARPGTYTVVVDVVRTGTEDVVQTLTLALDRPSAALRAVPSTVLIDEVQSWPRKVTAPSRDVQVILEETTGATRAAFTVMDTRRAEAEGHRVAAGMTLGTGMGSVAAGAAQPFLIAFTGAFPPGKTTGSIEVRSDQAKPLEIKYELRSRLDWPAVIGALALGWLVGFVLRVGLTWYVARQHALGQIAELEHEARGLDKIIADPALGAPELVSACEAARKNWKTAEAAVVKLRARLDAVRAKFQPVLDAARLRIAGFARAVSVEWRLPADVAGALASLRRTLADANAELSVRNASAATRLLDEAFDDKVATLCKRIEAWRTSSLTTATLLEAAPGLAVWPVPTGTMAADAAVKWRALLMAVPTEKPADNDALAQLLRAIDTIEGHLAAAARQQLNSWRMVLDVCVTELADLSGRPLAQLVAKLPDVVSPELALAKLTTVAKPIADELRVTVLGLMRADDPGRKQVEATISDGKWALAAKQTRELLGPGKNGGRTGSKASTIPIPTLALTAAAEPVSQRASAMIANEPTPSPLPSTALVAVGKRRAPKLELAALTTTSVISAGLLLMLFAVHFATDQAATWLDLVGVAVQAGSVDLGIAALATAAKNLTKA